MNYGKIAMLHRISGRGPIVIYAGAAPELIKKLYDYLQELCNTSQDLKLEDDRITTCNPFLAWHLKEVVQNQSLVPQTDNQSAGGGVEII